MNELIYMILTWLHHTVHCNKPTNFVRPYSCFLVDFVPLCNTLNPPSMAYKFMFITTYVFRIICKTGSIFCSRAKCWNYLKISIWTSGYRNRMVCSTAYCRRKAEKNLLLLGKEMQTVWKVQETVLYKTKSMCQIVKYRNWI